MISNLKVKFNFLNFNNIFYGLIRTHTLKSLQTKIDFNANNIVTLLSMIQMKFSRIKVYLKFMLNNILFTK